jgi:hypothetical protein
MAAFEDNGALRMESESYRFPHINTPELTSCSCVPVQEIKYSMSFRSANPELDVRDGPEFSTDGTCGPAHGNTICDPNSKVYTGGCCSVGETTERMEDKG